MIELQEWDAETGTAPWKLPSGWEWISLGTICDIVIGGTPSRNNSDYWGSGHTWISIADMNDRILFDSKEQITDLGVSESNVKEIDEGTLLISFKLSIGKIAIAGKKLYTNEAIAALPIKDEWRRKIDRDFIFHALRIVPLEGEVDPAVKGKTLNKAKLARLLIPLPFPNNFLRSLDTQKRLVSRIEAFLVELKEVQKTLNQMRRDMSQVMEAVLTEIFTESVMENWSHKKVLRELIAISASQVDPKLSRYKYLPHIGPEAIESGTCRLGQYNTAEEDQISSNNYLFSSGDILYSKIRPYLRKAAFVDFEGLCSADIYPLTITSNDIFPRFLLWSLVAPPFTDYAKAKSGRARMPKINRSELFAYELRFPDLNEQQYIVNHIDAVQFEVDRMQKTLQDNDDLLKQVEQAILYEAFRGEI